MPDDPKTGLPLTADERKLLNDRIEALEKREHVSKADIQKLVEEIVDARAKAKKDEADEVDPDQDW